MKITFKDVGQGDSILLEWEVDGVDKVGIIDCNKKEKSNPVAEYIDKCNYKEIEFIILSHPHSDHFSGMLGLLDIIEKKGIKVLRFAHTLLILGSDYFKFLHQVEYDISALLNLKKLIERVSNLRDTNVIKKIDCVLENWQIELKSDTILKCLSPSHCEAEKFVSIVNYNPTGSKSKASSAANYLSTLFKLVIKDKFYLFTSDSEIFTFERLLHENTHKNLVEKKLHICQLPHHGSSKNYLPEFWDFINKGEDLSAVASAGYNPKYKHPHFEVLKSFHLKGYKIYSTNIVHGMEEYAEYIKEISHLSTSLDTFSELIDNFTNEEKVFDLTY
jgi:beta-lactamase superfamily II metal-dependent hydrolase